MSDMEDKLSAILGNPQMMQQIMHLAQSMGSEPSAPQVPEAPPAVQPDPAMLQSLAAMAGQGQVDSNQKALLTALSPYLSKNRVQKLDRAMRAAKLAGVASQFLDAGGLQMLMGR